MLMVKAIPGEKVHDMIALKSNMKTLNMHWTKDREDEGEVMKVVSKSFSNSHNIVVYR